MSYTYIVSSNYVSVMNLDNGKVTKITKDNTRFNDAVQACKEQRFEDVEKMTVKNIIMSAKVDDTPVIEIRDGLVYYMGNELNNEMTRRIVKMVQDGFDAKPFINFMTNLMQNPSSTAVNELYLFLEATELPLTIDGCFIAYKMVRDDYTSIYDGKFKNTVGEVVEMPRNMVDDNRNNTCSHGLHFCSKEYLTKYGSSQRDNDRLLLVKINPADVVSIPSDYNNSKGRASKYLIWKDITEPGWREKYFVKDYNESSVEDEFDLDNVDGMIKMLDRLREESRRHDDRECPACGSNRTHKKGYNVGRTKQRFKCQSCGHSYYEEIKK